jgi:hypothetical protein
MGRLIVSAQMPSMCLSGYHGYYMQHMYSTTFALNLSVKGK